MSSNLEDSMRMQMGLADTMRNDLTRVQDWKRLVAMVGRLNARRSYDEALPVSYAKSKASIDPGLQVASCWSAKPDMSQVASGSFDKAINTFLDSIPTGQRVWITFWHEPENDIGAGMSLADWNNGIIRMAQLIEATGRPDLHSAVCMMGWTWNPVNPDNPDNYRPACEAVDLLAVDVYGETYYGPPDGGSQVQRPFEWAKRLDNTPRLSVWETSASSEQPLLMSTYIRRIGDWCAAHDFVHYLGFNSDVGGATPIVDGCIDGRIAFTYLVSTYGAAWNRDADERVLVSRR
jgi:hypothetical protein